MKKVILSFLASSVVGLVAHSNPVSAAGFALIEQGVKGLGNAYAGGAASADDASTVFFNPAGMTRLSGRQAIAAGHLIVPSTKFSDGGSHMAGTLGGAAMTGGDGGNAGEAALVPNLYYVQEFGNGYRFGLGINAPFGLATDYDDDWKGRYQAIRSEIITVNINPSLALKVNDRLSLGGGVNLQYIDAELTSAVDYTVACFGVPTLGAATCSANGLGVGTLQSTATSGMSKNTADDLSWGYNLGLLYEFDQDTRVGLAYRSKISHKLEGTGDFTIPSAVSTAGGGVGATLSAVFADSNIIARATLPEMISASIYHQFDPKWAVMGDITHTRWSRLPELRIDFENSLKSDGVEALNWENTWRYSVGVTYFQDERWTWRGGVAFDETPVPNPESRTARLPDNDRKWLAVGGSYHRSKDMSVDFGYAHLFISDPQINRTGPLGDVLIGSYENTVDILSVQLTWNY
ncbi:MAG: outer membrane protein transport protein [Pseudomonadota bacterium]